MVDDDRHVLAGHRTAYHEEATGSPQGVLRQLIYIRYELGVADGEECRVIEQRTIDTALIRAFLMDELEVAGLQQLLVAEVCQALGILDLSHADGGTADIGQFVGTHLGEHPRQVAQLVAILQPRPLVGTIGQILIVVLACIVTGVEEILKVIETDTIDRELLSLCLSLTRPKKEERCQ